MKERIFNVLSYLSNRDMMHKVEKGHSVYYELFWPLCAVKKGEHPWDDITLVWPK